MTSLRVHASRRSRRIVGLLAMVVVLSGLDLTLTLGYMQSTGMFEDNPIVRLLLEWTGGSSLAIAVFKATTVHIAIGLLYSLRDRVSAELAAWLAVAILVTVTIQWARYAGCMADLDVDQLATVAQVTEGWVKLK